jgi:hypothetical protein
MARSTPQVTVVIPTTLQRDELLRRAVASVRAQEGVTTQIVVVADVAPGTPAPDLGADVNVLTIPGPSGAGVARNAGVAAARADWVAFLDDDDAWRQDKLARQLTATAGPEPVVVACRFRLIRNGRLYAVLPRRNYRPDDEFSEWLYCEHLPFGRAGWVIASTFLAPTALVRRCPFRCLTGEDAEFLLRATSQHGVRFVQVDEPLVDYYVEDDRNHNTGLGSWEETIRFVRAHPDLFTSVSAPAAILTTATRVPDAARNYPTVVRSAFASGRPRITDLLASAALAFLPAERRRSVVNALSQGPPTQGPPSPVSGPAPTSSPASRDPRGWPGVG